jgi:hypothetical protein
MKSSAMATSYRTSEDALDVRQITPAIGAEVHGVRLSGELPAEMVTAIRDAAHSSDLNEIARCTPVAVRSMTDPEAPTAGRRFRLLR